MSDPKRPAVLRGVVASLSWLAVLAVIQATAAHAQPVSTCGQTVTNGVLTQDLDCPDGEAAIYVAADGTLDLAGFTVTGGAVNGIGCEGNCAINGSGGVVTGAANCGISGYGTALTVTDISVFGNSAGICSQVISNDGTRLLRDSRIVASQVTIANNAMGIGALDVDVSNAVLSDNTYVGVWAYRRLTVDGSSVSGSGDDGIRVEFPKRRSYVTNSTIEGSARRGVRGDRLVISGTEIRGSGGAGIQARTITIENSVAMENGLAPCADICADVVARRVKATNLTCDSSLKWRADKDGYQFFNGLDLCAQD